MRIKHLLPLVLASLFVFSACTGENGQSAQLSETDSVSAKEYATLATARLTVSEGKRLIAKGIAANKDVRERLQHGMVIITLGTGSTTG